MKSFLSLPVEALLRSPLHSILFASLIFVLASDFSIAANPNRPHPHQGLIEPYEGDPPEIVLSQDELYSVSTGTPVYKQVEVAGGGRAAAIFLVNAPQKAVWSVISDFSHYPEWISSLTKAKVYKKENGKTFVEFELSAGWFGKWTYYVEHKYPESLNGHGTWRLDYGRQSDLDDSVGFWTVKPFDSSGKRSLVTYSVEIRVGSWVPNFVRNLIVNGGLKEATQWVKLQSEKRFH